MRTMFVRRVTRKEAEWIGTYLQCVHPGRNTVVRGIIWERAKVAKGRIIGLVVRARRIVRTRFMLRVRVEHAGREER